MAVTTKELRLALGMRGGVSLAVWIGGACDEINRLCHAIESTDPDDFWKGRLDESGYDAVAIDVMAGASAGGLNAVLMSAAQHYGFPFERIRELWLRLGGIQNLRRTDIRDVPSLLDGDGGFLRPLQQSLLDLIDGANCGPPREQRRPTIDVRLSATHVEPLARPSVSPLDEPLDLVRSGAWFHFRHTERFDWLPSDYPPYEPPDGDPVRRRALVAATWRLAIAARATSSFPVAFEGAVVRSSRPPSFREPREDLDSEWVDMFGVFSDSRGGGERPDALTADDFVVLDGGWLDNIPLRRALDAIAVAPAHRPTDRYLVYLQPGIPHTEGPTRASISSDRRSTLNVGQGMVKAIWTSETIAQDIAALEQHNQAVARAAGLRATVFSPLAQGRDLQWIAEQAWLSYRTLRASHDADRLRQLLDDPVTYLSEDPFPDGAGPSPRSIAPLAAWTSDAREALDAQLGLAFLDTSIEAATAAMTPSSVLLNGLGPLTRTTRLLLEWALHLEARNVAAASTQKQVIYRTMCFIDQILNRNRRISWVTSAASATITDQAQVDSWINDARTRTNGLLCHEPEAVATIVTDLKTGSDTGITTLRTRCAAMLDGSRPDPGETADIREALIDEVLVGVMDDLLRYHPTAGDDGPGALLDQAIRSIASPSAQRITALEIVCMPEFLAGAPGERPIRFVRMSAANGSPLASEFTALRRFADENQITWPSNDVVPLDLKLAGNDLFNFAAFFDETWRANDWMWGRLDAVPTLIDLVIPPDTSHEHRTALIATRQRQILADELAKRPWPSAELGEHAETMTPVQLSNLIRDHDVGTQTLTNPRRWEHADVLHHLSAVAGDVLRCNAATLERPLRDSKAFQRAVRWSARAVTYGGRIAATTMLAPRSSDSSNGRLRFVRAALRAMTSRPPSR